MVFKLRDIEGHSYKEISDFSINNILFIPGLGERIEKMGGNVNTINVNTSTFHPVFRAIYEIKDNKIYAQTILAGGQSGRINSEHYKDQIETWRNGKYKTAQFLNTPDSLKNIKNIIKFK